MAINDELGKRMKEFYETVPKTKLMRREPVIVRVDGRAFHTFTRGFLRPFDNVLMFSMQATARRLCESIQGAKLAYTQSDEISILLTDYETLNQSAYFDYEIQKMCSTIASTATLEFNRAFAEYVDECCKYITKEEKEKDGKSLFFTHDAFDVYGVPENTEIRVGYMQTLHRALEKGATFDCRVFNIPKEEVTNYFYWRQLDATRNSIQMAGQANFSNKELLNKTSNDIQDMLMTKKGINWNDYHIPYKRGSCCVRGAYKLVSFNGGVKETLRHQWLTDEYIPIFKGDGRDYIERFV